MSNFPASTPPLCNSSLRKGCSFLEAEQFRQLPHWPAIWDRTPSKPPEDRVHRFIPEEEGWAACPWSPPCPTATTVVDTFWWICPRPQSRSPLKAARRRSFATDQCEWRKSRWLGWAHLLCVLPALPGDHWSKALHSLSTPATASASVLLLSLGFYSKRYGQDGGEAKHSPTLNIPSRYSSADNRPYLPPCRALPAIKKMNWK
jgi:hypothetical protein